MTVSAHVRRFLCLPVFLACAAQVAAQVSPNTTYRTLETEHFRVSFEPGLESQARHAAAVAERARAALSVLVAESPSGTIDILVTDNVDYTNGYAQPFPSNRITIYARPPVDDIELQYIRDWIELVVTHELAHIYHLDVTGGFGKLARSIFGRLPAPWPIFPAIATPGWSIEGLATVIESNVTGFGRTHGSYEEMIVRTAVLEGGFNDIDMLASGSPEWPGGSRIYIYGSLFLDYLNRRFGADAIGRIVRTISSTWIPPFLWFNKVGTDALGVSFRTAYRDWQVELSARYVRLAREIRQQGVTEAVTLTTHRNDALYPRYSPDGQRIAYTANDGRTNTHLRVIDAQTGAALWSERRNAASFSASAWINAEQLIASDLDYTDPFHVRNDLYRISSDDVEQLTVGSRYEQPDVRNGSTVVVRNGQGTNQLVLLDIAGKLRRELTTADPLVHWSFPRFSPRGDRIAVARWRNGGRTDIVVMDTAGNVQRELAEADGVTASPVWTPDERWIIFQSDRTGIPNLFAVDPASPTQRIRQVTNVLTGVFMPDVSPDGKSIVMSALHSQGFRLERVTLDTAAWREPSRAGLTTLERGTYENVLSGSVLRDSVNAAVAAADSMGGPTGKYRALRHMRPYFWVPVIETAATKDFYLGAWTSGEDLVGRHFWEVSAAVDPSSGRTQGLAGYTFRGLPSIGRTHPSILTGISRYWDVVQPRDSTGGLYVEEREDVAQLGVGLSHPTWRASTGLNIYGELVRRSRHLYDAPSNLRLRDARDDLYGVRANTFFANYSQPSFAISRQDGVLLQLSALQRWERDPFSMTINNSDVLFDGSYSELVTRNAVYRSLPFGGFARHVVAVRAAGIRRSGPGAGLVRLGGASASGLDVPGLGGGIGGSYQLLSVRGFGDGARRGNIGWAASAEYRVPIALISTSLRPLPIYFDRLAAAAFVDAGHAWCDEETAARFSDTACRFTSASETPLATVGLETIAFFTAFTASIPVRGGVAFRLAGSNDMTPRLYLVVGVPF